jgi:hypothetical protein
MFGSLGDHLARLRHRHRWLVVRLFNGSCRNGLRDIENANNNHDGKDDGGSESERTEDSFDHGNLHGWTLHKSFRSNLGNPRQRIRNNRFKRLMRVRGMPAVFIADVSNVAAEISGELEGSRPRLKHLYARPKVGPRAVTKATPNPGAFTFYLTPGFFDLHEAFARTMPANSIRGVIPAQRTPKNSYHLLTKHLVPSTSSSTSATVRDLLLSPRRERSPTAAPSLPRAPAATRAL